MPIATNVQAVVMINTRCTECGATMLDGVLTHTEKCSANNFLPRVGQMVRPPSIELSFDSAEEKEQWLKGLKAGSSNDPN